MDKFYLVMPANRLLTGSEGTPEALPNRLHVNVLYTLSAAEDKLLYLQEWYPDQDWVLMEAISYAAEKIYKNGIYCITPTVPDYRDNQVH